MIKGYKCSNCGKEGVKLWRPFADSDHLFCAECAEKKQFATRVLENPELERNFFYIGNDVILPRWRIDEHGKLHSCEGTGEYDKILNTTNILFVILTDKDLYTTCLFPAIPIVPNQFNRYFQWAQAPDDAYTWWERLPTR